MASNTATTALLPVDRLLDCRTDPLLGLSHSRPAPGPGPLGLRPGRAL